jgi:hypothetical protein
MKDNPIPPAVSDETGQTLPASREFQTSVRLRLEELETLEEIRSLLGSSRAVAIRKVFLAGASAILARRKELEAVRDIISPK